MNKDLLIESLVEKYFSKKPAFVFEHTTSDYRLYRIETYTENNPEDKDYIRRNKKMIKNFLDTGYEHFTKTKFLGFRNADSVRSNTTMLKLAVDKETETILAMTVYSTHFGGLKCIGGTVLMTEDKTLRVTAKEALMQITREDVKLWGKFVWTECSDSVEDMWKNAEGIMIPAAYLPLFFDEYTMESVEYSEKDPYHYTRLIGRGTVDEKRIEKMIFGFPNRAVLEKYISERNTTLEELCKTYGINPDDLLNEGFYYRDAPKHLWPYLRLIRHYYDEIVKRGHLEFTELEIKTITKSIEEVYGFFGDQWDNTTKKDGLRSMMIHFVMMFNRCSVLKVYEFGDTLQLEEEKFKTAFLIPGAL